MIIYRSIFIKDTPHKKDALDAAVKIAEKEGYEVNVVETVMPLVIDQPYRTFKLEVDKKYTSQVPDCKSCEEGYLPSHYPSENCESGKRPHCTCDTCF